MLILKFFLRTLDNGLRIYEAETADLKTNVLPGELIFKLYDTYGFPTDLTADIARERELEMDVSNGSEKNCAFPFILLSFIFSF